MAVLSVVDVVTGYDGVTVLHGVSLEVESGETVGLLGANGAGKSTTLRAIMRQLPLWKGRVFFDGVDLTSAPSYAPARLGMSYVQEGRGMLGTLTVRENLEMGAYRKGARARLRQLLETVLDTFPPLAERLSDRAMALSGGQQQMLAIGRAMMNAPGLIILDEPSLGLAPKVVDEVYAVLGRLQGSGLSILLVEQNVARALQLCQRAYVLEGGHVSLSGCSADLVKSPQLEAAYLGGSV